MTSKDVEIIFSFLKFYDSLHNTMQTGSFRKECRRKRYFEAEMKALKYEQIFFFLRLFINKKTYALNINLYFIQEAYSN